MENLEKAIAYTKKKKKFQLRDNDTRLQDRINVLNGYLNNQKDDSTVGLNFERLSNQYLWQYIDKCLQQKKLDYELLSKSTRFALEANNWNYALGTIYPPFDYSVLFNYSTMHLGQLLHLGWVEQAKAYGHLLLKMLYGKHYTGGNAWAKHPWFIIELFCKWQNITLDQSKLHYPDNMGVYQAALDAWDTQDVTLLSELVDDLCNFHIKQSNEDVSKDEYGNEFGPEFSSADYFIFPVEILTWLAIRKQLSLPAYEPAHELMQLEINQLPTAIIPFQQDELILKCKAKLVKDNPGLEFGLDIIPPPASNSRNLLD